MSLADEYRRQFTWRSWAAVFDALPSLEGRTVLDLGCGAGDIAAEMVRRGARVIGIEANEALLRTARSRRISNAEFRAVDLRAMPDLGVAADGLWCSFAAAYFVDLETILAAWTRNVRAGGWICLTEIDDMFGHEPMDRRAKAWLAGYAAEAIAGGRYDFHMGRKLRDHMERAGLVVSRVLTLDDQELSFSGPARPEVVEAWRSRFDRMPLLRAFCGADFDHVRESFLDCIARGDHRSLAKVCCCIATKGARGGSGDSEKEGR